MTRATALRWTRRAMLTSRAIRRRLTFPLRPALSRRPTAASKDAFVTELNPSGSALVYSTYLGGSNYDFGIGIAVNSAGNALSSSTMASLGIVRFEGRTAQHEKR